jgi:hypothetical protein
MKSFIWPQCSRTLFLAAFATMPTSFCARRFWSRYSTVRASRRRYVKSPETYVGYDRGNRFVSPGGVVADKDHTYAAGEPQLNEWSLIGNWTVGPERAQLDDKDGSIVYRFHARDLHLVLGPSAEGSQIRFRVRHRRQGTGRCPRHGCRCRRKRRRDDAAAISARSRSRISGRSYFRDSLSRSRRTSLRLHLRLMEKVGWFQLA